MERGTGGIPQLIALREQLHYMFITECIIFMVDVFSYYKEKFCVGVHSFFLNIKGAGLGFV